MNNPGARIASNPHRTMRIAIKRAYELPADDDGCRILVDRLWPRALSKEHARIDLWLKEIGPSSELRKWFGHDPARWPEFERRYIAELHHKQDLLEHIRTIAKKNRVTLVYAARDQAHNNAVVLSRALKS